MPHAQPFALDNILARRRDIKQQVDDMILEQVDFVDVEKTAICLGEQARLKGLLTRAQRPFQIKRANHAVLGRAQRQIDKRHRHFLAIVTSNRRQQRRERAHRSRFTCPAVAKNHDATNPRIDRRDEQRALHFVLTDDGGKRESDTH